MRNSMITLAGAALALSLGTAAPALAASTMCDHNAMKTDAMAGDAMSTDGMAKDAMMTDGMAKDTAMAGDKMGADAMGTDAMGTDAMGKDAMAKDPMMAMTMDYTVKAGDSLWSIAESQLCDGEKMDTIIAANADMLGADMMIHPGQVLHIPGD